MTFGPTVGIGHLNSFRAGLFFNDEGDGLMAEVHMLTGFFIKKEKLNLTVFCITGRLVTGLDLVINSWQQPV